MSRILKGNLILILNILLLTSPVFVRAEGTTENPVIRYVALGDSYTIGTGARHGESWVDFLVKDLVNDGIAIQLVANPAKAGWTTQNLIDQELPVLFTSKADFITLMIGVNDWVQGINPMVFQKRFAYILETLQLYVAPEKILIVNIPDFSAAPKGYLFSSGRYISEGLSEFNSIIAKEAAIRRIKVVDIFTESQKMKPHASHFSSDGLHPSKEGYAFWEKKIYPSARDLLRP